MLVALDNTMIDCKRQTQTKRYIVAIENTSSSHDKDHCCAISWQEESPSKRAECWIKLISNIRIIKSFNIWQQKSWHDLFEKATDVDQKDENGKRQTLRCHFIFLSSQMLWLSKTKSNNISLGEWTSEFSKLAVIAESNVNFEHKSCW